MNSLPKKQHSKKLTTRKLRNRKLQESPLPLKMLTCYDFQTAQLLNTTDLDMILVGDSLGNVILGYETTIEVSLNDMITFGAAVKRGAPHKFTVVDMPFGTYATIESGIRNATKLFQKTRAEAIKVEGASKITLDFIKRCTEIGIPVQGHIGLTPQSIHQQGGYFTHGKTEEDEAQIYRESMELQEAGCFSIILECIKPGLAKHISKNLSIPTIGIGSGSETDGQVLVINDLLKLGPKRPPSFCTPMANLYETKKDIIEKYLLHLEREETNHGTNKE